MQTEREDADFLIEIATATPTPLRAGVVLPKRTVCPEVRLPLTAGAGEAARPRAEQIRTVEELGAALAESRRHYAPFLENHAPTLPTTRTVQAVDRFEWRIERPDDRANFDRALAGEGAWETVTVPHYGPPLGTAATLYRTVINLTPELMRRDRIMLCFAGVDYACQVYLNGVCIGSHEGFFDAFEFDCTGVARESNNVLLVRVVNDYPMLGSRAGDQVIDGDKIYAATGLGYDDPQEGWHHCPPAMGIYNRVTIEGRSRLHIEDLWVRPLVSDRTVDLRLEIKNAGTNPFESVAILVSIFGRNFAAQVHVDHRHQGWNKFVRGFGDLDHGCDEEVPALMGLGTNYIRIVLPMGEFRVWDLETPWLYQAQIKLLDAKERVLDVAERQFGMRSFVQDEHSTPKGKFMLNGREIRLRGANTMGNLERCVMQGDFDQLRDDILLAKLTHMNFLRLTQRPVHREVYEWCDRLGLMLQTDLPLFATVRRNQFLEVVAQAARMEHHIRAHPSSILVSFINEPRPEAAGKPHRFVLREEMEKMFEMCIAAVRQQNPDRVIKCVDGDYDPPAKFGMPDNHCYCGWYIGHGIDLGAVHHGDWLPVKPGWHYGCGEFGAEGLDSFEVMQKYYPATWRPHGLDAPWSPDVIARAQSWGFHFLWYDTPRTTAEWIEASQKHQDWIVRMMTEAYRRNAMMNSFAVHLFIDAWPAGWMKTIMDVARVPKKAWFTYRDVLTPTAVSLRCDRTSVWSGESVPIELWVCNDRAETLKRWQVHYDVRWQGTVVANGTVPAQIDACAPRGQGIIEVTAPETVQRGIMEIGASLINQEGRTVHDTTLTIKVFPAPAAAEGKVWLSRRTRAGVNFVRSLGLHESSGAVANAQTLFITDHESYQSQSSEIQQQVREGACAVFLSLPPGKYTIGGSPIEVRKAGMGPRHFVSRATGHPLVEGFDPDDFKFWYSHRLGRVVPILHTTLDAVGWRPILQSGDGEWLHPWNYAPAAVERADGNGCWRVCQVELAECVKTNPAARLFALRLLAPQKDAAG
jgi:hypothetical protein